jgi:hypothetical protein
MPYHSKNSSEFVGLRRAICGRTQIVYDVQTGMRVVLNIETQSALAADINAALQEGIKCRNVLWGTIAALKSRSIEVDFASIQ